MDSARSNAHRILIVEDEALIAADLADALEQQGFEVVGIEGTADQAIAAATRHMPDLALLDIRLRGQRDGIDVATELRKHAIPFVFLTANSDPGTLARAELTEPSGYLVKPFDERSLYATVRMALYRAQADAERRQRRAMLASAVDRIARPTLGLDHKARVRWENAPARKGGVQRGASVDIALTALGRAELVQPVQSALGAAEGQEVNREEFQLVPSGDGFVLVVGPSTDAPLCLCAWCQKARSNDGSWEAIESVLKQRYGLLLTHGICQTCVDTHFADFADPQE